MDVTKKRGLGRGLGALIAQAPAPPKPAEQQLPIDQIAPNPWQPRLRFEESKIQEMADSIREQGVVQPLVVRRRDGGYELVAGERRLRAAKLAGLDSVPVRVRELSDRDALEIALIENVQREDLSALEEAGAYQRLVEEFSLTQDEVAKRVGKSRPAVANTLRLLALPEPVRDDLRKGALSAGHARALCALESAVEQIALGREAIRRGLSVRQLEALIKSRMHKRPARKAARDLNVADLEKQLQRSLGTKVRVSAKGHKGKIIIEYYSLDELDRLLAKLR